LDCVGVIVCMKCSAVLVGTCGVFCFLVSAADNKITNKNLVTSKF